MLKSSVKQKFNNRYKFSILLVVLIAAMALSACGGQNSQALQPTTAVVQPDPTEAVQPTGEVVEPTAEAVSSEGAVSFAKDVLPIMQNSCVNCHGGERTNKGLDVTSYDKLMAGSVNGAVIVPNDADGSKFVQLVADGKMPKRGAKLTAEQVQLIKDWVNAGALNN